MFFNLHSAKQAALHDATNYHCYYKQLHVLDEVFVISRIIKVEVTWIISRSLGLITLTETLVILDITKIKFNYCFIMH